MRRVLAAVALLGAGASAEAAVVTFDGLPPEDGDPTVWVENGVTVTPNAWLDLGWFRRPGTAHLDDGGSGHASQLGFTLGKRFDARSLDLLPVGSSYQACTEEFGDGDCDPRSFENVMVTGLRGGAVVASDLFDMVLAGPTYLFDASFRQLDELVIGFGPPPREGDLGDGTFGNCFDVPCTHFDIDNVTLAPVPLPAPVGLLGLALAGLGLAARRRG